MNPGTFLERHLRHVISCIESGRSVDLMAIGIGHDVTRYYRRAVTITDPEELGEPCCVNSRLCSMTLRMSRHVEAWSSKTPKTIEPVRVPDPAACRRQAEWLWRADGQCACHVQAPFNCSSFSRFSKMDGEESQTSPEPIFGRHTSRCDARTGQVREAPNFW